MLQGDESFTGHAFIAKGPLLIELLVNREKTLTDVISLRRVNRGSRLAVGINLEKGKVFL